MEKADVGLLIKNDAWDYVTGEILQPIVSAEEAQCLTKLKEWIMSDIILAIHTSEFKQTKCCTKETWLKLERVCQSSEPARKVKLLR